MIVVMATDVRRTLKHTEYTQSTKSDTLIHVLTVPLVSTKLFTFSMDRLPGGLYLNDRWEVHDLVEFDSE